MVLTGHVGDPQACPVVTAPPLALKSGLDRCDDLLFSSCADGTQNPLSLYTITTGCKDPCSKYKMVKSRAYPKRYVLAWGGS